QRVSRHNGRAGKHGVYNPKHNDRQFDVAHADNIDKGRTSQNLYWDWQNGLRDHEANQSGQYPSFNQVERDFYEQRYGDYLAGQAARNIKAGHAGRNRTVDDLLADVRICPEETIYQIGKEGDCPPPDVLLEVMQEFMDTFQERFGKHVHILDWALHLDETSPHIHARQVFDIENRYGEIEPKQEKTLEALGIPLPFPEKKAGKMNNRKITFDGICRELLLNICEEHGLDVERDAIYGGKANRDKNDYIIEAQREKIAELERRNAELTVDNEAQSRIIAQKNAELEDKLEKLSDADAALDAVTDVAYREAVKVVAAEAIQETQKQDLMVLEKGKQKVMSPEIKMKQKERDLVLEWFEKAANTLKKRAKSIFEKVVEALRLPATREAAKQKIKEQAKPSIHELLRTYKQKSQETRTQKPRQHSWEER
ncbi:MAG: serine/arginine repetitive matrix protein 2, partial [Clostridiales bacterium]|nr:serine/arginine repetitive matrix protein 2 [Clostridiales bacterium]